MVQPNYMYTHKRQRLSPRPLLASCTTVLWGLLLLHLPASFAFLSTIPAHPHHPHAIQSHHGADGHCSIGTATATATATASAVAVAVAVAGTRAQSRIEIVRRRQTSEANDGEMESNPDETEATNSFNNKFTNGSAAATFAGTSPDIQATVKPAVVSKIPGLMEQRDNESDSDWRRRQERFQRNKELDQKAAEASAAMDLPEQPLVRTLQGGPSLIFAMAKRMWDPKFAADGSESPNMDSNPDNGGRVWSVTASRQEYATIIWKNARKGNKPGMWRYAVRTFDRMMEDEKLVLTTHYEGALTACAKLGMWEHAFGIYHKAVDREATLRNKLSAASKAKPRLAVRVNDNMIMSLLGACVRASRQRKIMQAPDDTDEAVSGSSRTRMVQEQQRIPLDAMVEVLQDMEARHGLTLTARHLNPVAAAYLSLGLVSDAASLLQSNLADRTTGPEAEDGEARFNVNDLTAKDKGSYSLLVQGAVSDADWAGAVDALKDMTEAGLYPVSRHLNTWTEVSERKTKRRATRSWKKKRDESYLDSVR